MGSGKRLNAIEKGQIEAFRDFNLPMPILVFLVDLGHFQFSREIREILA